MKLIFLFMSLLRFVWGAIWVLLCGGFNFSSLARCRYFQHCWMLQNRFLGRKKQFSSDKQELWLTCQTFVAPWNVWSPQSGARALQWQSLPNAKKMRFQHLVISQVFNDNERALIRTMERLVSQHSLEPEPYTHSHNVCDFSTLFFSQVFNDNERDIDREWERER